MNDERCPGCGGSLADGKCTIGCEAKEPVKQVELVEVAERLSRLCKVLEEFFPQLSGKIRNV